VKLSGTCWGVSQLIGQGLSLCRSEKVVIRQGHGSREFHIYLMKQRIEWYVRIPH
jgi:hypothetical protein